MDLIILYFSRKKTWNKTENKWAFKLLERQGNYIFNVEYPPELSKNFYFK